MIAKGHGKATPGGVAATAPVVGAHLRPTEPLRRCHKACVAAARPLHTGPAGAAVTVLVVLVVVVVMVVMVVVAVVAVVPGSGVIAGTAGTALLGHTRVTTPRDGTAAAVAVVAVAVARASACQ